MSNQIQRLNARIDSTLYELRTARARVDRLLSEVLNLKRQIKPQTELTIKSKAGGS